jgi:hypothetical protein
LTRLSYFAPTRSVDAVALAHDSEVALDGVGAGDEGIGFADLTRRGNQARSLLHSFRFLVQSRASLYKTSTADPPGKTEFSARVGVRCSRPEQR